MKRGGPIPRYTPLNRKPFTPSFMVRGRRPKQAAYQRLRALVHAREGGNCAMCGLHAPITEGQCHHRLMRSRGGKDDAVTCVWLCSTCHGEIHAHPDRSTAYGWLVPSNIDPAAWPVYREHHWTVGWWQPGEFGWDAAEPHARQAA